MTHNGSLFYTRELREELQARGYQCEGPTDTEVLAKRIGHYHAGPAAKDVRAATERAVARCEGTWGLAVPCADAPGELVVTSHGSPLYIGVGDEGCVASFRVYRCPGHRRTTSRRRSPVFAGRS